MGTDDVQSGLEVTIQFITTESDVSEASGLATQNLVSLYKALGGGWDPGSVSSGS